MSNNNPPVESKICPACEQTKGRDFFYLAPKRTDGLRTYCIQCTSDKKRKKDNPSVYKITNTVNGKVYIGQSWDTRKRWGDHKNQMEEGSQDYIHRAMRKYGWSSFTFETLVVPCSQICMDELEIYFISFYESINPEKGYNLTSGGRGGKKSEVSRKKSSESQQKRFADPTYIHPMKGKKHSPESCRKMSESRLGQPCPWNSIRQKELLEERGLEYYSSMGKLGAAARWGKLRE